MVDVNDEAASHLILTLGSLINYNKSVVEPTQEDRLSGVLINPVTMTITLPQEKIEKVINEAQKLLKCQLTTACQEARMVEIMSSCIPAVTPPPLLKTQAANMSPYHNKPWRS